MKIVNKTRGRGEELAVKKEAAEEAEVSVSPLKEDIADPVSAPNPLLLSICYCLLVQGKRKRKPKELVDDVSSFFVRMRKKSSSSKSNDGIPKDAKGGGPGGSCSNVQIESPTMSRAVEFMLGLSNDQPSFVKSCVRSNVAGCCWMGLPVPFCKTHLPRKDTEVILENVNTEEFPVKYLASKTGLSAGWRKFLAGNKLVEGDVLIFQLIGPCRFKVYVISANNLTEVDGTLGLPNLDLQTKQNDGEETVDAQKKKKRHPKSLPLTVVQKMKQKAGSGGPQVGLLEEQRRNDSDEVASEVLEGAKFSGSVDFKDVKSFEEFHIVVNGACVDSDLPEDIRLKYYELCCSKNSFLHDSLLPGLYIKLATGMIVEFINIADLIRKCKPSTPRKDFDVWEKSLRSFELLGLKVGFVRSRLRELLRLAFETVDAVERRRYKEMQKDQSRTKDEIQKLEAMLVELREASAKRENELENLRMKTESYDLKFQEEVDAPW